MDTPITDKKDCLTAAVEIVKAYAASSKPSVGDLTLVLKNLYTELVKLMKDAEQP